MYRCPACGTVYQDDARFCTRDGTRLVAARARSSERSGPAVADVEPSAHRTPTDLGGRMLDGRYVVEHRIGEGGMASVYLATDAATGEPYAVKVLSAALSRDRNAMARLRREASVGMRLAHPNVCPILRLGETDDDLIYVVMPYVPGEVLSDRIGRKGVLTLGEVVPYVRDVAAGLQAAHDLGIVHRDLKPENVMIAPAGAGAERAVVMDFGLAKERRAGAELQKLTATGMVLGTPEFMSPEQLRGKPLDGRSDVYALALMTFEMLTGTLPFVGATQQEVMIARLLSDPVPLRRARPELEFSEPVERVLLRGMRRDPIGRYPSAPAFAAALARAADAGDGGVLARLFGR